MKYIGKKPSGEDKEVPVYCFAFGRQEARLIRDLLVDFISRNKLIFEATPAVSRARNIIKELNDNVPMKMPKYSHDEKSIPTSN